MHPIRSRRGALRAVGVLAALALPAALLPGPSASARAARPDLQVTRLAISASTVVAGRSLRVTDTTANRGVRRAGPSTTAFWLSTDRTRSAHDVRLGAHPVGRLRPGRHLATTIRLTVPAGVRARGWHLIACADSKRAVTESHEGNNCRSVAVAVTRPRTAGPLAVTPTLADSSTSKFAFGDNDPTDDAAGDPPSVITTSYAGTTYTLRVPAHALNQTVNVTMTPLTAVAGAPMSGGFVGGVKIEPTGIELDELATLTVTPAQAPDWTRATGFRFFDGGSDFGMVPLDRARSAAGTISVPVGEFATYAVGNTSAADRSSVLAHPPTRAEGAHLNRLASLIRTGTSARVVTGARSAASAVGMATLAEENAYYDHVVKPGLDQALTNDATAPQAVYDAFAWLRELALFGMTDGTTEREVDAQNLIGRLMVFAADSANTRCVHHHLPDIARLLAFARWFFVLGDEAHGNTYFDDAQHCGKFEVRFDDHQTVVEHDTAGARTQDVDDEWALHAAVPIGIFDGTQVQAPLNETTFRYSDTVVYHNVDGSTCTYTTTSQPPAGPGKAIAYLFIDLRPNTQDPKVPAPPLRDGLLQLSVGGAGLDPTEPHSSTATCGSPVDSYTSWSQYYHFQNPYQLGQIAIPHDDNPGPTVLSYDPPTWTSNFGGVSNLTQTDQTHVVVLHVPD